MRKLQIVCAVLLCSISLLGQKTRYEQGLSAAKQDEDFPLTVHVFSTHVRSYCKPESLKPSWQMCIDVIYADVTAGGKKFELRTDTRINQDPFHPLDLPLGDYHARYATGARDRIGSTYDLLLPKNKVLRCTVTGLSE